MGLRSDEIPSTCLLCDSLIQDDQLTVTAAQRNQLDQIALGDSIECELCHAVIGSVQILYKGGKEGKRGHGRGPCAGAGVECNHSSGPYFDSTDAIKQNLSSYDIVLAHDISGMVNSTCLEFITVFKIEPEACDEIYEALVDITLGLEEDLADFLSDSVCNLAGICSSKQRQSEDEAIAPLQIASTQDLVKNNQGQSLQCSLCEALAGTITSLLKPRKANFSFPFSFPFPFPLKNQLSGILAEGKITSKPRLI